MQPVIGSHLKRAGRREGSYENRHLSALSTQAPPCLIPTSAPQAAFPSMSFSAAAAMAQHMRIMDSKLCLQ